LHEVLEIWREEEAVEAAANYSDGSEAEDAASLSRDDDDAPWDADDKLHEKKKVIDDEDDRKDSVWLSDDDVTVPPAKLSALCGPV